GSGGIQNAKHFNPAVFLEHARWLRKNIAEKYGGDCLQTRRTIDASRLEIIDLPWSAGCPFRRDIAPSGVHLYCQHILVFAKPPGNFVTKRQVASQVLLQFMSVDHGSRTDHHTVKLQENP